MQGLLFTLLLKFDKYPALKSKEFLMKKALLGLLILIGSVAASLSYYGLFAKIEIREIEMGPYYFAFDKHQGEYRKIGPVFSKLYYRLMNDNIDSRQGLGIYFDNPRFVEKTNLRSIAACLVDGNDPKNRAVLDKKYMTGEIPRSLCAVVEFPYKGNLSVILGVMKVYPKLAAWLQEKKYPDMPLLELYDQAAGKTFYIAPTHLIPADFQKLFEKEEPLNPQQ